MLVGYWFAHLGGIRNWGFANTVAIGVPKSSPEGLPSGYEVAHVHMVTWSSHGYHSCEREDHFPAALTHVACLECRYGPAPWEILVWEGTNRQIQRAVSSQGNVTMNLALGHLLEGVPFLRIARLPTTFSWRHWKTRSASLRNEGMWGLSGDDQRFIPIDVGGASVVWEQLFTAGFCQPISSGLVKSMVTCAK